MKYIFLLVILFSCYSWAHDGGVDRDGCHGDVQTAFSRFVYSSSSGQFIKDQLLKKRLYTQIGGIEVNRPTEAFVENFVRGKGQGVGPNQPVNSLEELVKRDADAIVEKFVKSMELYNGSSEPIFVVYIWEDLRWTKYMTGYKFKDVPLNIIKTREAVVSQVLKLGIINPFTISFIPLAYGRRHCH